MIKKIHHCKLFAAPGIYALHFSNFAKVVLQCGSVVEIENAKGNKGMGLIVSRSFVLTSASLVPISSNSL